MTNLDTFLKMKLDQLSKYRTDKVVLFRGFYDDISNDKLREIFSILHCELNDLFSFMNSKISPGIGGHFNANESRELLELIDITRILQASIENELSFEVTEEYKVVIEFCRTFLSESGGSPIPEDFERILLIEARPIFILRDATAIQTVTSNEITVELKEIGNGSYATVYKYKDPHYGFYFVVKRAKHDLRENELKRFKNEFNDLKSLDSPFIIKSFIYNDEKNEYTMEYADETLGKYISRNNSKLSYKKRRTMAIQLLTAFEYIHDKGFLHRDISYDNILIKHFNDGSSLIKVADFGLIKRPNSTLTRQGTEIKGAINDYSDLSVVGFENYEIRHETFALVKVIYFILTGRQSNYHREGNSLLKEFVLKGISSDKDERFGSVNDIRNELVKRILPSLRG